MQGVILCVEGLSLATIPKSILDLSVELHLMHPALARGRLRPKLGACGFDELGKFGGRNPGKDPARSPWRVRPVRYWRRERGILRVINELEYSKCHLTTGLFPEPSRAPQLIPRQGRSPHSEEDEAWPRPGLCSRWRAVKSSCTRSTAGKPSPSNPSLSRLTSRPGAIDFRPFSTQSSGTKWV